MRVRLLGPVDVLADGNPRLLNGARRKALLAALALPAGRVVDSRRLIELIWQESPPPAAANALQRHISHLRTVLGAREAIIVRQPGYLLDLGPEPTDVRVAERLLAEAAATADPGQRIGHLRAAIRLWCGAPLAEIRDLPWFDDQARRLDDLLLRARLALLDARLALHQGAQVIADLEELARAHPWHEEIGGLLMRALYGAGRQADALAAYRRLRHSLNEELGIDPGPRLRDLEAAVLRQDPSLATPAPVTVAARTPAPAVPAQLPHSVAGFAGREAELATLDRLATRPGIIAIAGTAGVGKTTLGLHWAHRIAPRFPGGQLYANLRGFDPGGSVVDPHVVVRVFLEGLGVPAENIPVDLEAQVGLYRTVLADREILVVLDNARDSDQIRPLLPGSAASLVIVTSRRQLSSLVANEGAHTITLDRLTGAEATALLAGRLGAERVAADPDAVARIVERCAHLPLALAIAAARAATRPAFPLARIADELRDALDALRGDEPSLDARAVFSWSYHALSPAAARLLRLLGLHPGPEIDPVAAAGLAAVPVRAAEALLSELAGAHLVEEPSPDRYGFHDLLRAYAAELAAGPETDAERVAAIDRMLDHYLYTAFAADRLLDPSRDPIEPPDHRPVAEPAPLADEDEAQAWFAREHPVLLALIKAAAQAGRDAYTIRLAWALNNFHNRRDLLHDWVATNLAAVAAAERTGERRVLADAHRELGRAYTWAGRLPEAGAHLREALDGYDEAHDHVGRAHAYLYLSRLSVQEKLPAGAIDYGTQALALFRTARHRPGEARTLNALGWQHILVGEARQSLAFCTEALRLQERADDLEGQGHTWDTLGYAHHHLGEYPEAARCFGEAFRLFEELDDQYHQADILVHLGDTHQAAGDLAAAEQARLRALRIFDELGHMQADRLRTQLQGPLPSG